MKRKAEEENLEEEEEKSISICIPSSVISSKNAYNLEQITNIIYQIAKAATIFKISEIIVFKSSNEEEKEQSKDKSEEKTKKIVFDEDDSPIKKKSQDIITTTNKERNDVDNEVNLTLLGASLLQFFITPPYLIKTMFSPHLNKKFSKILPKFKYAFKLPKITTLDLNKDYKEGMIIPRETPLIKKKNKRVKSDHKITVSKYVNIGESNAIKLDIKREIPIYSRVTVDLKNNTIISAKKAYGNSGFKGAFGYHVRMIDDGDFNKVFTQSIIPDGYSKAIYINCNDYFNNNKINLLELDLHESNGNLLVVLGNLKDYSPDIHELFDNKLTIPSGCKIEDAMMIALTKLT